MDKMVIKLPVQLKAIRFGQNMKIKVEKLTCVSQQDDNNNKFYSVNLNKDKFKMIPAIDWLRQL